MSEISGTWYKAYYSPKNKSIKFHEYRVEYYSTGGPRRLFPIKSRAPHISAYEAVEYHKASPTKLKAVMELWHDYRYAVGAAEEKLNRAIAKFEAIDKAKKALEDENEI